MKKIILIFSLLLFTAVTFAQTNAELAIAKNRKIDKCISGDCENGTGVSEVSGEQGYYSYSDRNKIVSTTFFYDKRKSEGQWKNGKLLNGTGYLFDAVIKNKEIKYSLYYGEVKDGKRFGTGTYVDFDGNYFEGKLNEKNEYISVSDPRYKYYSYEGGMINGCYSGKGLLIFNEKYKKYKTHNQHFDFINNDIDYPGKQYEGVFENSRLIKGNILYEDGSKEETEKIDAMNDKVKRWDKKGFLAFEGTRYINGVETGAFFNCQGDCENGFGKRVFEREKDYLAYYEGNWKNGLFDGKGIQKTQYVFYVGDFVKGKKQGIIKIYDGDKIKDNKLTFEGEFINDDYGNYGTYYDFYYRDLTASWKVDGNKIIATILRNPNITYAGSVSAFMSDDKYYKYEGEVESKIHPHIRNGCGKTYKTKYVKEPIYDCYSDDYHVKSTAEQLAANEYAEAHKDDCDKCLGKGYIYTTQTVCGGTYTTGGETVNSVHTTSSTVVGYDKNSTVTTNTYSTYQNPTYTHTAGSYDKQVKITCPVCNGTGRRK